MLSYMLGECRLCKSNKRMLYVRRVLRLTVRNKNQNRKVRTQPLHLHHSIYFLIVSHFSTFFYTFLKPFFYLFAITLIFRHKFHYNMLYSY